MLTFAIRRLLVSALLLLAASLLMFLLVAASGDPLADLRASSAPNRDQLIAARTALLGLDLPLLVRYVRWLGGAASCLGAALPGMDCDLGRSLDGRPVTDLLAGALGSTLQLITVAAVAAVVLGVAVGITTALRPYGLYDHAATGVQLLFFALPVFWVAVLLKQYAIGFNDFLADPRIPLPLVIGAALLGGALWAAVVGGPRRRRAGTFALAAGATAGVLLYVSHTRWLLHPRLGPVVIAVSGVGIAVAVAALSGGLRRLGPTADAGPTTDAVPTDDAGRRRTGDAGQEQPAGPVPLSTRPVLLAALAAALLVTAGYLPVQQVLRQATVPLLVALVAASVLLGAGIGALLGGVHRARAAGAAALSAGLTFVLVLFDRFLQRWPDYLADPAVRRRPVATFGDRTPQLGMDDMWIRGIDTVTHLALPTVAILLVSFATYSRYTRAGLLEELGQDYVRTARSTGLGEPVVVLRHALRNALIPLTTVVTLDAGTLVGGAVITERVFGRPGMGALFVDALTPPVDPHPIMAFFVVTGALVVLLNLLADLGYGALDPRIRVQA